MLVFAFSFLHCVLLLAFFARIGLLFSVYLFFPQLLLDEATSALDTHNEKIGHAALDRYEDECGVICTANQ